MRSSGGDSKLALFLDVDGTLIDIATTPSSVVASPGLVDLLQRLSENLDGALALVSGRSIVNLDLLLAPLHIRAAGVHGAEIRDVIGGGVQYLAPALDGAFVESVRRLADLHPGVIVEPKRSAIAVHYRQAEELGPEVERRLSDMMRQSEQGLDLRPGRKVVELIPRHVSKGGAVQNFLRQAPFLGRQPIMIGDDHTDLSAFEAVESLGGRGLRVAGEFFDASSADFGGTADVRQWLSRLAEEISTTRTRLAAR